ncbi:hypothetical protein [Stutzerimonas decontaminans]|uniref:hypothetical protein n=1 Tax=Stutzerimonas decontaminans TaxID=3022791 RepID=UPI0011AFBFBC|nr:hypothetical protein [Stutzerimonas decontaminans]MCQ4246078.1 hypothetical protein [Stutzerimonas decontaminans]
MSRKRKQEGNPLGLVILLIGWLVFVFTLLATSFIWLGWLITELLYAKHPRVPDEADILLNAEEEDELSENQARTRAIEKRLQRIEIEGQQLRRRKDGLFHAGSALGAVLNAEISELAAERSDCQAICHELFQLPVERLRQWSAPLGRLLGFRWAISIYIGCLAYGVTLAPSSAVALHGVILRNLGEYLPALSFPLYGAMALSSIVAVCAGGAAYLFYNRLFYNHYAAQFERH